MATTKKVPAGKVNSTAKKTSAKKVAVKTRTVTVAKPAVKPAVKPVSKPVPDRAATATAPLPSTRIPAAVPPAKPKKPKLVRDSFTIPKPEYAVLDELKQRVARAGLPVKKSELLRAGIKALAAMSDSALLAAVAAVPAIKTGRPAKD